MKDETSDTNTSYIRVNHVTTVVKARVNIHTSTSVVQVKREEWVSSIKVQSNETKQKKVGKEYNNSETVYLRDISISSTLDEGEDEEEDENSRRKTK